MLSRHTRARRAADIGLVPSAQLESAQQNSPPPGKGSRSHHFAVRIQSGQAADAQITNTSSARPGRCSVRGGGVALLCRGEGCQGAWPGLRLTSSRGAGGQGGDAAGQLQLPTPPSANTPSTQAPPTDADDIGGRLHFGRCQHPASPTPLASPRVQRPRRGTEAQEIPAWAEVD